MKYFKKLTDNYIQYQGTAINLNNIATIGIELNSTSRDLKYHYYLVVNGRAVGDKLTAFESVDVQSELDRILNRY